MTIYIPSISTYSGYVLSIYMHIYYQNCVSFKGFAYLVKPYVGGHNLVLQILKIRKSFHKL